MARARGMTRSILAMEANSSSYYFIFSCRSRRGATRVPNWTLTSGHGPPTLPCWVKEWAHHPTSPSKASNRFYYANTIRLVST